MTIRITAAAAAIALVIDLGQVTYTLTLPILQPGGVPPNVVILALLPRVLLIEFFVVAFFAADSIQINRFLRLAAVIAVAGLAIKDGRAAFHAAWTLPRDFRETVVLHYHPLSNLVTMFVARIEILCTAAVASFLVAIAKTPTRNRTPRAFWMFGDSQTALRISASFAAAANILPLAIMLVEWSRLVTRIGLGMPMLTYIGWMVSVSVFFIVFEHTQNTHESGLVLEPAPLVTDEKV